jgi:bifunctional DNA-binding transcriptional regulator/antitoxin component of YhaV-PrlF toxin-antitoxin module
MRVSLAAAFAALGWPTGTEVVLLLEPDDSRVEVRPFDPAWQWAGQRTATIDPSSRLTLPPGVRSLLGLVPGDQVLIVALPDEGRLILLSAAGSLATLSGRTLGDSAAPVASTAQPSGVRPRWRPRLVATATPDDGGTVTPESPTTPNRRSTR